MSAGAFKPVRSSRVVQHSCHPESDTAITISPSAEVETNAILACADDDDPLATLPHSEATKTRSRGIKPKRD